MATFGKEWSIRIAVRSLYYLYTIHSHFSYLQILVSRVVLCHYANMSVQYSAIFKNCKNDDFLDEKF